MEPALFALFAAAWNLQWIAWGLGALVAFFLVRELFRKDEAIEDRRRHAIEMASELKGEGLEHIPDLLTDYAVGDYSGMAQRVKHWFTFLRDDDNRRAFFAKFLKRQLQHAMTDTTRRTEIFRVVDEWRAKDVGQKVIEAVNSGQSVQQPQPLEQVVAKSASTASKTKTK